MQPFVKNVTHAGGLNLVVEYCNGEVRSLDAAPFVGGGWYDRLKDSAYFAQVSVVGGGLTIGWPEGHDICPEDLYALSVPV